MLDVLLSLLVVVGTAWLGRVLLDARELGWGRLLLAALMGIAVGDATALFLLAADVSEVQAVDFRQLQLVSLPFRVVATMGSIVVLELAFRRGRAGVEGARGPTSRRRPLLRPGLLLRAFAVSRVLARHGLAPLVGWGSGRGRTLGARDLAARARRACEEAGGVFVKLGQLLATRPDLLPPEALSELAKLQSSAAPVGREEVAAQVEAQLGRPLETVFASFDWEPLGSASIAQAHAATLRDGSQVVVKVRRPGLERVIDHDLAIIGWLARTAERRFPWARRLGVAALAREFADALLGELDFTVEARNIEEVAKAVADEPLLHVPAVHAELTRPGLLVIERLAGSPLAEASSGSVLAGSSDGEPAAGADGAPPAARPGAGAEPDALALADALCRSQVRAMLAGERFHGDPHPGNVLLLDDGRLGLIDMGISSRLDAFERAAVFQMLLALRHEQPTLLYESMVTIGAVDQAVHDPEEIERAVARFMAAYLGPGLPPARALTDLLRLTLELGLRLPPSTSAMFRALATLMGTLEQLHPGYPVIERIAELGGDEFERRLMPGSLAEFVRQEWTDLGPLLARLPRHVDRLATMAEHGRLSLRARLLADADDRRFVERLLNRSLLALLSVGTGVVSVMLLGLPAGLRFPWFEVGLYEVLGWIGLFIAMTLMFRVLLAVLRSEG
ncbi:MAG TPA: AarF/UbiB family protein [Trueperaceae bacterium]